MSELLPALRPQLPDAERLLPYLRRIDDERIYTNWGPLNGELQARLAERLGVSCESLSTAASGTDGLIGAILAAAGPASAERPVAVVPGFTFVATAHAVERCGYEPLVVDVDPGTWALDPAALADRPDLDGVGVVVPVAAFGRPVPQTEWVAFTERTGIPVVIDGAASFDRLSGAQRDGVGQIPMVMSFHATKAFSSGEGGCIACSDAELIALAAQTLNFGFHGTREARTPGTNGKLSEYHAAIGLAELDRLDEKLEALDAVFDSYRRHLSSAGLDRNLTTAPEISASYVLYSCAGEELADRVRTALTGAGIGHRRWYGRGLTGSPQFAGRGDGPLPVTERLGSCLIGLPLAPDLLDEDVARIAGVLSDIGAGSEDRRER